MDDVQIRQASLVDLEGLAASSAALFTEDGAARDRLRSPEWPERAGAEWCAGLIADPNALVLTAVVDQAVVGHLIATSAPESVMWTAARAEIVSTFVAAPWRGRAVGSRLLIAFVDWARGRGALRLTVSAYASNTAAIRFYRKHGFGPLSVDLARDL